MASSSFPSGGGGSPGGSTTQVQFNDSSAFAGNAGLTFTKTTGILAVGNPGSSAYLTEVHNLSTALGGMRVYSEDTGGERAFLAQSTESIDQAYPVSGQFVMTSEPLVATNIGDATTLVITNNKDGAGTADNLFGLDIPTPNISGGTVTNNIGINIRNHSGATNNYAIKTGTGLVSLGDLLITTTHTPSAANDTGSAGTVAWDASFVYVCISTNTWKRVAIATW